MVFIASEELSWDRFHLSSQQPLKDPLVCLYLGSLPLQLVRSEAGRGPSAGRGMEIRHSPQTWERPRVREEGDGGPEGTDGLLFL